MKLYIFEKKVTAECAVLALPNEELKKCDIVTTQSLGIFKYDAPPSQRHLRIKIPYLIVKLIQKVFLFTII